MNKIIRLTGLADSNGQPISLTKELPSQSNSPDIQILAILSKGDKVVLETVSSGMIFGAFIEIRGEVSEIEKLVTLSIPTVTIQSITIQVEVLQVTGYSPSKVLNLKCGLSELWENGWRLG